MKKLRKLEPCEECGGAGCDKCYHYGHELFHGKPQEFQVVAKFGVSVASDDPEAAKEEADKFALEVFKLMNEQDTLADNYTDSVHWWVYEVSTEEGK